MQPVLLLASQLAAAMRRAEPSPPPMLTRPAANPGPPCPQEGARLQLQRGQLNCGVELCQLLVEAYVADGLAPSDEAVRSWAAATLPALGAWATVLLQPRLFARPLQCPPTARSHLPPCIAG